jgi:hypothetical protein
MSLTDRLMDKSLDTLLMILANQFAAIQLLVKLLSVTLMESSCIVVFDSPYFRKREVPKNRQMFGTEKLKMCCMFLETFSV